MRLPEVVPYELLRQAANGYLLRQEQEAAERAAKAAHTASQYPGTARAYGEASHEEIERALSMLPKHFGPGSYETWLKILMAVHSELGDAGAALCERYVPGYPGEIESKFRSFDPQHGVTIATLFGVAKEYGYKPLRSVPQEEAFLSDDEIIAFFRHDDLPFDLYDYRAEDGGILDAWIDHYGLSWLYVTGYDNWYVWGPEGSPTHWQADKAHGLDKEMVSLISAMNRAAEQKLKEAFDAPEETQKTEIKKAQAYLAATRRTSGRIASVTTMARGFRATPAGSINAGNTLNLRNGTLNLDTLTLHEHSPTNLLTYCLPFAYDPDATAEVWESRYLPNVFVEEDTYETDESLIALAQELLGYSLTFETNLEVMVWLYGEGGNGKTVFIEVLKALLGPMATSVDFQTIGLPGNYDLAKLPGMRVAFSTESERGGTVAEGYVKRLVSGEHISARPIYGTPFDFKSTSKIWWAMNDKPVIKSTSSSLWRRLRLLPFYRKFAEHEKDVDLLRKLLDELPGILNFALAGLRRLRANGGKFTRSASSDAFLQEYIDESNPVGQWLAERTLPASTPMTAVDTLYSDYMDWCKSNGRNELNKVNFGRELKRLRVLSKRSNGTKYALYLDRPTATELAEGIGL